MVFFSVYFSLVLCFVSTHHPNSKKKAAKSAQNLNRSSINLKRHRKINLSIVFEKSSLIDLNSQSWKPLSLFIFPSSPSSSSSEPKHLLFSLHSFSSFSLFSKLRNKTSKNTNTKAPPTQLKRRFSLHTTKLNSKKSESNTPDPTTRRDSQDAE